MASVLRLRHLPPQTDETGDTTPRQVASTMVGSAFCIVSDRYLMTAHHIFNKGESRDPNDTFYAFVVPKNDGPAYYFPVISFPIECQDSDMAVFEIGPCATPGIQLPALPVTFDPQPDGTPVVTVGFPAPEIAQLYLDEHGNFAGGDLFLKSYANDGIVSAQYAFKAMHMYELNVDWHHAVQYKTRIFVCVRNRRPLTIDISLTNNRWRSQSPA